MSAAPKRQLLGLGRSFAVSRLEPSVIRQPINWRHNSITGGKKQPKREG
jgi:hypothetical protein